MNISASNNLTFKGLWENKKPIMVHSENGDNVYVQDSIYHPFQDEKSPVINRVSGCSYLEYDSYDDNYGNEEGSISIHREYVGEKLSVTKAGYKELLKVKAAGLKAIEKLKTLGSEKPEVINGISSYSHDTKTRMSQLDRDQIESILNKFDIKA